MFHVFWWWCQTFKVKWHPALSMFLPFLLSRSDWGSVTASPAGRRREVQGPGRGGFKHPGEHTDAHRTGGKRRGRGWSLVLQVVTRISLNMGSLYLSINLGGKTHSRNFPYYLLKYLDTCAPFWILWKVCMAWTTSYFHCVKCSEMQISMQMKFEFADVQLYSPADLFSSTADKLLQEFLDK